MVMDNKKIITSFYLIKTRDALKLLCRSEYNRCR